MKHSTWAAVSGLTAAITVAGSGLVSATATAASTPPAPHAMVQVAAAPAWTAHATRLAAPSASKDLSFTMTLAPADQAAAAAYAESVSDPASTNYREYLTPAQYAARFGPTASSTAAVKTWLSGQGLRVTGQGTGYLRVSGDVTSVNAAFHTTMGSYRRDDLTVAAPTSAISVPASIRGDVQAVVGLDTSPTFGDDLTSLSQTTAQLAAKQYGITLPANATASPTMTNSCGRYWGQAEAPYLDKAPAPANKRLPDPVCGYTPAQLNAARGVTATGLTGKGATVGIVLWCDDPNLVSDVSRWAADVGAKKLAPQQITIDEPSQPYGSYCTGSPGIDQDETSLDAEAIHGAAPDARIVYAPGTDPSDDGILDALHRLVDANSVDVINDSYAELESELTPDVLAAYESVFLQAAAQGISVLYAAGDKSDNFTTAPAPNYPAADPWVTSIGGTSLGIGASNDKVFEEAWFEAGTAEENNTWGPIQYGGGGGGGGVSTLSAQPYYQKGVVPASLAGATPMRVYPDIANIASPVTPYLVGYTAAPLNTFIMVGVGGTSLASPYTAGQVALAVQQDGGRRAGFLNPAIYAHGAKDLTDLSSNTVDRGVQLASDQLAIFGIPLTVETLFDNGQSLAPTTLSLAPGYDNLSGMGVPANEATFISLVNAG